MDARFQFSIRFLLVATAAIAAGVAAVCAEPSWQSTLATTCLTAIFATAAIVGVMQTSGRMRAFFAGAAFVLCVAAVNAIKDVSDFTFVVMHDPFDPYLRSFAKRHFLWVFWGAAPVNGLFAVFIHWLFVSGKPSA